MHDWQFGLLAPRFTLDVVRISGNGTLWLAASAAVATRGKPADSLRC